MTTLSIQGAVCGVFPEQRRPVCCSWMLSRLIVGSGSEASDGAWPFTLGAMETVIDHVARLDGRAGNK